MIVMRVRNYTFIEFIIWFLILSLCIFCFRIYKYNQHKKLTSYQIFMADVDGMTVGSPVKYLGVQIGYIENIKLLPNNVYVKFIVTEKDLKLPQGVIATVEFSGMGGSKSLELYPPDKKTKTDKLIVVDEPTRLNDALGLLGDMYFKLDSIIVKYTHFTNSMANDFEQENNFKINTQNLNNGIRKTDNFMNTLIKNRTEFIRKIERLQDELKKDKGIEQSDSIVKPLQTEE